MYKKIFEKNNTSTLKVRLICVYRPIFYIVLYC